MFKNRFILITAVLFVLLVSIAISNPFSKPPTPTDLSWPPRPVIIPMTGANELSDYYQRHSERSISAGSAVDVSDYYMRHPELRIPTESIDLSDYYQRHSELRDIAAESADAALSRPPHDECFDVSISEVADCREASQSTFP